MEDINSYKIFLENIVKGNSFVMHYLSEDLEIQIEPDQCSACSSPYHNLIILGLNDHASFDCLANHIDLIKISIERVDVNEEVRNDLNVIISIDERDIDSVRSKLGKVIIYKCSPLLYRGACSFILFHELGHILNDCNITCVREREITADKFAFSAILENDVNPIEQNPDVLGTLVGLFNIFYHQGPTQAKADEEHPHPLDRVGTFLDMAQVSFDSPLWDVSCRLINECLVNHNISKQPIPGKCTSEDFKAMCSRVKSL